MDIPMLYVQKISSSMMVISKIKDSFSVVPEKNRGDNNDCQCSFCYFSNLFMNCILASDEDLPCSAQGHIHPLFTIPTLL